MFEAENWWHFDCQHLMWVWLFYLQETLQQKNWCHEVVLIQRHLAASLPCLHSVWCPQIKLHKCFLFTTYACHLLFLNLLSHTVQTITNAFHVPLCSFLFITAWVWRHFGLLPDAQTFTQRHEDMIFYFIFSRWHFCQEWPFCIKYGWATSLHVDIIDFSMVVTCKLSACIPGPQQLSAANSSKAAGSSMEHIPMHACVVICHHIALATDPHVCRTYNL